MSLKSLPWREVWTEPRAVLLRVRDLPLSVVAVVAVATGGLEGLLDSYRFVSFAFSDEPSTYLGRVDPRSPLGWVLGAAQGALLGLFSVFVLGWVVQWLGRLLGGVGTYRVVVHALAWPSLASVQMALLLFAVSYGANLVFGGTLPGAFVVLWSGLSFVLGLWLLVISVRMLSEAHDYASWRALLTLLLLGLSYAGLSAALPLPFS